MKRLIALNIETTGIHHEKMDRVIEIGCVELINKKITGNEYHEYLKTYKSVGSSIEVHKISDEFLADKPIFFDIADDFIQFISGSTLVIHNAKFYIKFIDKEFKLIGEKARISNICKVIDSIDISKKQNPTSLHTLSAICNRYGIDTSFRHSLSPLADAKILAKMYIKLTKNI
jgi:DNA polymerase-3 subunit epsilon